MKKNEIVRLVPTPSKKLVSEYKKGEAGVLKIEEPNPSHVHPPYYNVFYEDGSILRVYDFIRVLYSPVKETE